MEKKLSFFVKRFFVMRLCILSVAILHAGWSTVCAQTSYVGVVLNTVDSLPIEGVSIHGKNLGVVAKTDTYGRFSVSFPGATQRVSFSHIGFTPVSMDLTRKDGNPSTIFLTPLETGLEEVVVNTGIQQLPRERVTGSFVSISNVQLNEQIGSDVLSRLESVANSVSVDRSTNGGGMMIRGLSTIAGPREPLIVLDNFPYEGDLRHINPNDVEYITILKDAAAASIWGARAGNGVIVITTKQAKWDKPLQLSFSANASVVEKPNLFKGRARMDSEALIEVEKYLFSRGYYNASEQSANRPALTPVVELLIANRDNHTSVPLKSGRFKN